MLKEYTITIPVSFDADEATITDEGIFEWTENTTKTWDWELSEEDRSGDFSEDLVDMTASFVKDTEDYWDAEDLRATLVDADFDSFDVVKLKVQVDEKDLKHLLEALSEEYTDSVRIYVDNFATKVTMRTGKAKVV